MAEREYKNVETVNIKAQSEGRVRVGICAVMGNIDHAGDRILKGAFAKTIQENLRNIKFLWNHDYRTPPIASIKELREISREELPQEVLDIAPEATAGLLVKREYYKNDLADWVLQAIDLGDVNQMSFAYETIKSADVKEGDKTVRELQELRMMDASDVNWGCNAATVAAGAKHLEALPLGVIASQLSMISEQIKSGRRNAANDQKLVDMIHATSCELGAMCDPNNMPEEDSGKGNPAELETKDEADSKDAEAGAADISTPLSDLKLRAIRFRVGNLI